MRKNQRRLRVILVILAISLLGVGSYLYAKLTRPVLSGDEFKDLVQGSDTTIVLFYTDWCAGKNRIEDIYPQYRAKAKEKHTQIVLIAADNNISRSAIEAHAKQGFLSYRIDAGSLAIQNRRNIKKYVNTAFPNHHITELEEFGYPLPLELWVTRDFKVLNEKDLLDNIQLADWLLDAKTIKVKRE